MARREDTFVGLKDFGCGPVAVFEAAYPHQRYEEVAYGKFGFSACLKGGTYPLPMPRRQYRVVTETHFCLDLKSVRTRTANLKLPKNYGKAPWSLIEEYKAQMAILLEMTPWAALAAGGAKA